MSEVLPPASALLAQKPPMRLVDSILEARSAGVTCKATVGEDFIFLRNGEAECVVCIELVAQAIGCFAGLSDVRAGRPPRKGLLVGTRDAHFSPEKLRVGDELIVTVEQQWIREPAASFRGEVHRMHPGGGMDRRDELLAKVVLLVVSGLDPHALYESANHA